MKTLLLLRHAKSSWEYPELQDWERPLNKRGRKDAPKMGKWLKKNFNKPDLVLTSHSVRTLATISKAGKELGLKGKDYLPEPRLYHASPSTLWDIIRSFPDHENTAIVVGHNPGLTEFANEICPDNSVDNIPTCGAYAVKFRCSEWKDANQDNSEFLFFQYPKNLKQ